MTIKTKASFSNEFVTCMSGLHNRAHCTISSTKLITLLFLGKHIDNEIEELKQSPQNKIDVASQVQIVQYNLGKSFADLKPNELQVWMAGGHSQDQKQLAALIENANWRDLNFAIENLSNISINTSASRSRIEDTDFAKASSELAALAQSLENITRLFRV